MDCVFAPICCECAGADCESCFTLYMDCVDAYVACFLPAEPPRYPDARLIWGAPGGVAGTGPTLMIDGLGMVRHWREGSYDIRWEAAEPDLIEELGRVYAWLDGRLCRSLDRRALPSGYCWLE